MKHIISLIFVFCGYAFAKAQSVNPNLLQNIRHQDDITSADLGLVDVNGTPIEGSIMYDAPSEQVFLYNSNEWRKVYLAPKVDAKTANYTLQASDDGNVLTFNSTTDVTLTVPAGLAVGFNVSIYQLGSGRINVIAGAAANVLNRLQRFQTAGVNAGAGIICTAPETYHLTGDLKRM